MVSEFHDWYEIYNDDGIEIFDIWRAACEWQKEQDAIICETSHSQSCQIEASNICAYRIRNNK